MYENIVYGLKEPPSEEDIISLLKNLKLDDLIDIFKEKMNFKLGLDGNKLVWWTKANCLVVKIILS